jgi:hypothetical protein
MNKLLRIGHGPYGTVFCTVKFSKDGYLSITGVIGPKANGDCVGGCGQCRDFIVTDYAPGWNAGIAEQFREIWDRWHLNDMRAGSQIQSDYLRANPIPLCVDYYVVACETLRAAGLNPDPQGYVYGSAWNFESVPASVIEFLESLPESDRPLPGVWGIHD